jgi:hypothetical protein
MEYGSKNMFALITIIPVGYWYYVSPNGYKLSIFDASILGENLDKGKDILLENVPRQTERSFD